MNNTQAHYLAAGLCINCGKPRAPDGTTVRCRPRAKKASAAAVKWKSRIRAEKRAKPKLPTSSKRAFLAKKRRKLGLYLATVTLSEEHLDTLCKLEWLKPDQRASKSDIQNALAKYLHSTLVERYAHMAWARTAREQRLALPQSP